MKWFGVLNSGCRASWRTVSARLCHSKSHIITSPRALGEFVVLVGLWLCNDSLARATEPSRTLGSPIVLSDKQLDQVTAGAVTLGLDLTAAAQGPSVVAFTQGTVRSAGTTVLQVDLSPDPARGPGARLQAVVPATVFFAAGNAAASGASNPQCAANVETTGDFAFLTEATLNTATPSAAGSPMTVNCACAAFAIALGGH
jgi:hypothetical protein